MYIFAITPFFSEIICLEFVILLKMRLNLVWDWLDRGGGGIWDGGGLGMGIRKWYWGWRGLIFFCEIYKLKKKQPKLEIWKYVHINILIWKKCKNNERWGWKYKMVKLYTVISLK